MKAVAVPAKRERIEARVTPEQKALLQRAAALAGRSLTDFLTESAQSAAYETIRRHEAISLTARDSAMFVAALMEPAPPNDQLRAAAERHRSLVGG